MNPRPSETGLDTPSGVRSWIGDVAILLAATAGTYAALSFDRPRTGVLVYLIGVMVVGARSGLYRGILAAVLASFFYNFFLSEPVFRLGVTSLDELVPLLAFNVSAIVSGGLAGRLNDRAQAARRAEAKNALLLQLSDRLQRAISVADVEAIARASLSSHGMADVAIFLHRDDDRTAADREKQAGGNAADVELARLVGSSGELGVVRFTAAAQRSGQAYAPDLAAVASLLALALDRCILLEELSESRAAQRSEELKNALLSSVSHDLRTPLTAIEAAATSLRAFRSTLAPEQEDEMLATITEQCAKLNRYTANLLDMGRIQAGIPNSQLEALELVEILAVALGSIRKRFPEQEICKEVLASSAVVAASAVMLEQAIFNLLENAVIHGATGRPVLVRLTTDSEACFLEIVDSGPGIAPAEQARVFERFYRGGERPHREGSGLGLYIARGFVEAFGGTIAIHSPVFDNCGTGITVRLPLVQERTGIQDIRHAHPDR